AKGFCDFSYQFPFKLLKDVCGADFEPHPLQYPEDSDVERHAISRQAQFNQRVSAPFVSVELERALQGGHALLFRFHLRNCTEEPARPSCLLNDSKISSSC